MPSPALPAAALVAAVLALAACTPKAGDDTAGAAPSGGKDTCSAATYQSFVGKRIDVLNEVDLPESTRVLFPTTPATTDFREDRLNVAVGKDDNISRIFCG